jgi:ribosomal protein S18 acetylase RimI-like enzyme
MSIERASARIGRTVQIDDGLAGACLKIVRDLPDYFDERDFEELEHELRARDRTLYFAEQAGEVAGFALVERRGERIAEICWLAVGPEFRGQGVGSALLAEVFETLRSAGVELLEVKTLSAKADYPPYEATRRFYERAGFLHLETVDPYPGWGPENPCAIYVKALTPGAGA